VNKKLRFDYCILFLLLLSVGTFLVGAFQNLHDPLFEWDRVMLIAAGNWARGINSIWLFDHPPLYPAFLTLVFSIFGHIIQYARLANMSCVLLTAWIIFRLTSQLSNRKAGFWSLIFYLLSPLCIQGITDFNGADTSLLPLGFILLCYIIYRTERRPCSLNIGLIGIMVAFCFWAKITATLPLVLGLLTYPLIHRHGSSKQWLKIAIGCALGVFIFLFTWIPISLLLWGEDSCYLVLTTPFAALTANTANGGLFERFSRIGIDSLRIIFWFSPFLLFLFIWESIALLWTRRKRLYTLGLLAWTSLFYFFGHILIGGSNWGFPRYHAPILPLLAVLIGIFVEPIFSHLTKKRKGVLLGSLLGILLFYLILVNDPLLFLNLTWKERLLSGDSAFLIIRDGVSQGIIFLVLPLLICPLFIKIFWKSGIKEMILLILVVTSLSTIIFIDFKQMYAPYITSYQYGAQQKIEVVEKVSQHIKKENLVFATPEFTYDLRDKEVPQIPWAVWKSPKTIYEAINKMEPDAIIVGLTTHTLQQLKWIFYDPSIQSLLKQHYLRCNKGTYFIWFRK
jgi:hypothetical protein